jgi:ribosomal protein S16
MQINSKSNIIGYPAIRIRNFLRKVRDVDAWNVYYVKEYLKISIEEAESVLLKLHKNKYIENVGFYAGLKRWKISLKGASLSLAYASKPILRSTADKKIQEFLDRVKQVNKNSEYIYKVTKVVVFGSYLSKTERLGDIDLGVYLEPKEKDKNIHSKLNEERMLYLISQGMQYNNFVEQMFLPMLEIWKFLKYHSRSLSIHYDDKILETVRKKVIFEEM